mmetsp:Transcript_20829/g.36936  ORF Transcript_20829/g.36936 Transcript_20829/m.36936 type:complete len:111 (+) Transcript_20829:102-434(+)
MSNTISPLSLYRTILRLHRQKLPHHLREMGDSYVKKEFRDHRSASPEFVEKFVDGWTEYAIDLAQKRNGQGDDRFGKDLSSDIVSVLSDEQKITLRRLRDEASNFRRGEE